MEPAAPGVAVEVEQVPVLVRLVPPKRALEIKQFLDGVATAVLDVALAGLARERKVEVLVDEFPGRHVVLDEALDSLGRLDPLAEEPNPPRPFFVLAHEPDPNPLRSAPPRRPIEPDSRRRPAPYGLVRLLVLPLWVPRFVVPVLLERSEENVRVDRHFREREQRKETPRPRAGPCREACKYTGVRLRPLN